VILLDDSALTDAAHIADRDAEACCSRWTTWGIPVLVGAVVRVLYWVVVSPAWVPRSDARQYVSIAEALAGGQGFSSTFPGGVAHPTAFRPPLYPILLAVPTRIFGPDALWPGRLLAIVIGLCLIVATVAYVRRIAGDRAGLVAGLAVALAPSLIVNDTVTMTESLGLLLTVGILLGLIESRWALTGALCGLLLLTRPNAYLVLAVVAVVIWRALGPRRAFASLGLCAAVVAPWAIRNVIQVGTPKLVTSDGFTLAAMYGPPSQQTGGFMDPTLTTWYPDSGVHRLESDEGRWSDRLTTIGLRGFRDHPESVLRRAATGAASMFEVPGYRAAEAEYVDGRDPRFRDATLFTFPLLVTAGSTGVLLRIRDRRTWPALAIVGGFIAVSLVTVSVPRLRGPFDLLMCIGIGYLAAWGCTSVARSAEREGKPWASRMCHTQGIEGYWSCCWQSSAHSPCPDASHRSGLSRRLLSRQSGCQRHPIPSWSSTAGSTSSTARTTTSGPRSPD